MADTVQIGGIKLSSRCVQIDHSDTAAPSEKLLYFLQKVTAAKISIPHLHLGENGGEVVTSFCFDGDDFPRLQEVTGGELASSDNFQVIQDIGTVSVFPHRSSLALCLDILRVLREEKIPVHGVSTSVSALVFHTDYALQDDAVTAVLKICELPENHSPLRPVVVLGDEIVETIAVYWEPKVRIYGMSVEEGFHLYRFAGAIPTFTGSETFKLINGFTGEGGRTRYNVVCKSDELSPDADALTEEPLDVDIVSFHGPHFQDRYGIADLAFSLLLEKNISVITCSCTGTSVQLIVERGKGSEVAECLSEGFVVPSTG